MWQAAAEASSNEMQHFNSTSATLKFKPQQRQAE